jgi:hypothetical protein
MDVREKKEKETERVERYTQSSPIPKEVNKMRREYMLTSNF